METKNFTANRNLILMFLVIIIGFFIFEENTWATHPNDNISNENKNLTLDKDIETEEISKDAEYMKITSFHQIKSKEDLMAYREIKMKEMREILESTNQERYAAILTFNKPLSRSELDDIVSKYSLIVGNVRYISTEGGGEMPFEMINNDEEIRILESKMNELMRNIGNKTSEFKLVKGFTAARVSIPKNEVIPLSLNPNIFLVDLGPKELYENKSAIAEWEDVAYYVEKFLPYNQVSGNERIPKDADIVPDDKVIRQESEYNKYISMAIILITILSSLLVIYYKKFRDKFILNSNGKMKSKNNIKNYVFNRKGDSGIIIRVMILLIIILMALPYTLPYIPVFNKNYSAVFILFFSIILLFLALFLFLLSLPPKKFKRKRDWIEWLNILCIFGIICAPLFGINYIEEHGIIHNPDIISLNLNFIFYFCFTLVLTIALYFFRNINAYLLVAFLSVFLFFIGTLPFFGPIDTYVDKYEIMIGAYILVVSSFLRVILTIIIIYRNLNS